MTEVTVIIATFGNRLKWDEIAERAAISATKQTAECTVIRVHGRDLAEARNSGAARAKTPWLIFLDADDELDPHYVEEMLKATGDIRRPSTLGIVDGIEDDFPVMIPAGEPDDLFRRNFIVIGAMIRRVQFLETGGFDPSLQCLEDWDLFLALWCRGAIIEEVPDAIYRVNVYENSRNQNASLHGQTYTEIRRRYESCRQSRSEG